MFYKYIQRFTKYTKKKKSVRGKRKKPWDLVSETHSHCKKALRGRRNKMTPKRAEDLVFIHSNLRLLSRNSSKYREEETKLWDIGGDDFSLEDSGILQIASLSLDEPELEEAFFNEDEQIWELNIMIYLRFFFCFSFARLCFFYNCLSWFLLDHEV